MTRLHSRAIIKSITLSIGKSDRFSVDEWVLKSEMTQLRDPSRKIDTMIIVDSSSFCRISTQLSDSSIDKRDDYHILCV